MLTRKNLERLAKQCDYDPEEMGLVILKALGYKITKALGYKITRYKLSGAVYVSSKDGEKGLYYDDGAYVD